MLLAISLDVNPSINIPLSFLMSHSTSPTFVDMGITPALKASIITFGNASCVEPSISDHNY